MNLYNLNKYLPIRIWFRYQVTSLHITKHTFTVSFQMRKRYEIINYCPCKLYYALYYKNCSISKALAEQMKRTETLLHILLKMGDIAKMLHHNTFSWRFSCSEPPVWDWLENKKVAPHLKKYMNPCKKIIKKKTEKKKKKLDNKII